MLEYALVLLPESSSMNVTSFMIIKRQNGNPNAYDAYSEYKSSGPYAYDEAQKIVDNLNERHKH